MHKLVVMGVAGCGKSTLAQALAQALACPLIEGDDHHPPANRAKMSRGVALADADREPWLAALAELLAQQASSALLACSALKLRYREQLRARVPGLRFVHLDISPELAQQRVGARAGHFFPASVVASQFDALEPPHGEAGVLVVDAQLPLQAQAAAVLRWLGAGANHGAA